MDIRFNKHDTLEILDNARIALKVEILANYKETEMDKYPTNISAQLRYIRDIQRIAELNSLVDRIEKEIERIKNLD